MDFKHTCTESNANLFAEWVNHRGGVAVWGSLNLADPGQSWSTPADGKKPHWSATDKPVTVYTDPQDIGVVTYREARRFRVAVRRGSQGLSLKLTDASSEKLRKALKRAGDEATYAFDFFTQEAVILVPETVISLVEWVSKNGGTN